MRKLFAVALLLIGYTCYAQCPFTATLQNKGSLCVGKDTLVVKSANKLVSIKWYKDGVLDTTVNAVVNSYSKNGVTVAGGKGYVGATNQIIPSSVFLDGNGNIYVDDPMSFRILKFPPNSISGTSGTIVAGGNGLGSAANQLSGSTSIFVDNTGAIYVNDGNNNRIQKFPAGSTSATNAITVAGGNGAGSAANQLNQPTWMCVDVTGNIYVADMGNYRIQKFVSGATNAITVAGGNGLGTAANQFSRIFCVFVDVMGKIYVPDFDNNRIQQFPANSTSATNGTTIAGGNGVGSAANQFNKSEGIFVDANGSFYVADQLNQRIQRFPSGSSSITNGITFAGGNGQGNAANQFDAPTSVFKDAVGNMYVVDVNNYRIQNFYIATSIIDSTRILTVPGTYYAVAIDTSGCTVTTNSITIAAPSTPTISIGTYGSSSVCSPTNTVKYVAYTTDGGTAPAYQWQVNGVNAGTNNATFSAALAYKDVVSCVLTSNEACATSQTAASNNDTINLGRPVTIVLSNKGSVCTGDTLVVSSPIKPYIIQWYKDGVLDTTIQIAKTGYTANGITVAGGNGRGKNANQFLGATSLALDAMGNIYADDSYLNARVLKFPPNSNSATLGITVIDGPSTTPWTVPFSTSVDVNGNLFAVDATVQRVLKLIPGASTINAITVAGGNGIGTAANQFRSNAACNDGVGNIYVADLGSQRILKFPAGATSATNGVIVAGGNGTGSAANQLNQPYSVAVDNNGNIYVADYGNNRIQKFPPNSSNTTNGVTIAGGNGVGAAGNQFSGPIWVSLDANGNVFVADQINNRIQKFPPNSTGATNGVTVAGGNGSGAVANQLAQPCAVVVDSAGNIFVSDYQNYRIQKFLVNISSIDTTYIPHAAGTYHAIITDSAGCSITTNAIILAASLKPTANIVADKPSVCQGTIMGFTASATNTIGTPSYQWEVNGTDVGTNNNRYSNTALTNGDAVSCVITNGSSCAGSDTSNVIIAVINPLPVVGPVNNVSILLGQSVTLNIPVTGSISTYLWNPPIYLSNTTVVNPLATPDKTTVYTLKVTSVDSCEASGNITVTVIAPISIASAFTPNGDGKNDVFYVLGGLAGDKVKDFSIFNRWGKRLFQVQNVLPNDQSFGWNGTYNGELQQQGSYVYVVTIISASGKEQVYKGSVVLVR